MQKPRSTALPFKYDMKNHEWVEGKLFQTNKKYSQLKQAQQEKIYQWMFDAYRAKYDELGRFPRSDDSSDIVSEVMYKIEQAEIWIPYGEVAKLYQCKMPALRKRMNKELTEREARAIDIEPLNIRFSVCKVLDYSGVDPNQPFVFTGSTDEERSLVCPTELVPANSTARDEGWMCFRICGVLDFSLIGILARITKVLAAQEIGVFAISTFNTDYVLTKETDFAKATEALGKAGYNLKEQTK